MADKRLFVIDTDAGVDDAQAILMALSYPDVEVMAITTVSGNTLAIQIPVFVGCSEPLLGDVKDNDDYHGKDGFGDVPDSNAPTKENMQTEHGVQALLRMSKEHEGEITLICIGPLTNVAIATRMDPDFGKRLKACYIMGGNYRAVGNITTSAEFNFHYDSEAAYIVLNKLCCPITIVTWELCKDHSLEWDLYDKLRSVETEKAKFLRKIEKKAVDFSHANLWLKFIPCDEIAMATALNPGIILKSVNVYATVEFKGHFTCGQMVIDWEGSLNKKPNIDVVMNIDDNKYVDMLFKAVD
ncbi:hypothetical protein CHS0354_037551 [Potamilus streckersoni]|uniref:Inosine/uridine-preferring nucleoside hydrolase domain-containing protein n=1 Tax=Potamilus streckersoni TaxID=2493646 RepID=A0AAE0VUE0_9BIVA|nr:hypothetical protein CHS0354_037551 [Potamilus streckersoni]